MNKARISGLLRKLRLLHLTDLVRYYQQKRQNAAKNKAFLAKYPNVKLPPDYLMYESFQLDYERYYEGGKLSAAWIMGHIGRHTSFEGKNILDWGCGPARILRHVPEITKNKATYFGTDYNAASIEWCQRSLPGIQFTKNELTPPLPLPEGHFDIIYAISIFTHLSEKMHHAWLNELLRVARPGCLLALTFQGDGFIPKLTETELADYQAGKLVVRGQVKEGHRIFSAFHPPKWMRQFFSKVDLVEHIPGEIKNGKPEQDIWIIRKR